MSKDEKKIVLSLKPEKKISLNILSDDEIEEKDLLGEHGMFTKDIGGKQKHWFFTSFCKDSGGNLRVPRVYEEGNGNIQYTVFQVEKTKTGRLHYQGYVELKRGLSTVKGVQDAIGLPGAHVEVVRDVERAIAYCHKRETRVSDPVFSGERKKQGSHNGTCVKVFNVRLGGGKKIDCLKVVGDVRYSTSVEKACNWTDDAKARVVGPGIEGFNKTSDLWNFVYNTLEAKKKDIYYVDHKFSDRGEYYCGFDAHRIVVIPNPQHWFEGNIRTKLNHSTTIYLPRKNGVSVPLCCDWILYMNYSSAAAEIEEVPKINLLSDDVDVCDNDAGAGVYSGNQKCERLSIGQFM